MGSVYIFVSLAICMSSFWQTCDASCLGPVPCTDNSPCRDDQACLPSRDGTQTICRLCNCKDKDQCRTDTISGNVTCDCGNSGLDGPFCTCKKCSGSCPHGFTQYDATCTCYAGFMETVIWSTARERCRDMNASLAKITSDAENLFVANLVASLFNTTFNSFWLGGNDIATEGDWLWDLDSTRINPGYSNWYAFRSVTPNGNQQCLMMNVNIHQPIYNGLWVDPECLNEFDYICEYYP